MWCEDAKWGKMVMKTKTTLFFKNYNTNKSGEEGEEETGDG